MDSLNEKFLSDINKIEKEYDEIENLLSSVEIISDNKLFRYYQKKQAKINGITKLYKKYRQYESDLKDTTELLEIETDENEIISLKNQIEVFENQMSKLILELKIEYSKMKILRDEKVLVEISYKSGEKLKLQTLITIFEKFAEHNDFKINAIKSSADSFNFELCGENTFEILSFMSGNLKIIERNIESIFLISVIKLNLDNFEINEDDIKIETLKSGGAGGQHINKTESAVRLTHLPTGISVICQDERSQQMNKQRAMENLTKKLQDKFNQENLKKTESQRKMIKTKLFSSTSNLTIDFNKNNVFYSEAKRYYKLSDILNGNFQIIWRDLLIDGKQN